MESNQFIKIPGSGRARKPKTLRVCDECGKVFGPIDRLNRKFCSRKCAYRGRKGDSKLGRHYPHLQKARVGVCRICKKRFRATGDFDTKVGVRKQRYCSRECWSVRATSLRVCPHCGKEFRTSTSENRKYCSREHATLDPLKYSKIKHDPTVDVKSVPGYSGTHSWVERRLGKPLLCEHCGKTFKKTRLMNWANRDHKYNRRLEDWIRLCRSCHFKYDKRMGLINRDKPK